MGGRGGARGGGGGGGGATKKPEEGETKKYKYAGKTEKASGTEEVIRLRQKMGRYNWENQELAQRRIRDLVQRHKITYGDISAYEKKIRSGVITPYWK